MRKNSWPLIALLALAPPSRAQVQVQAGKCGGPARETWWRLLPGAPVNLRRTKISSRQLQDLLAVGFQVDKRGDLHFPDKLPVSEPELRLLTSPFRASTQHLDRGVWGMLMAEGYRLDESTCKLYISRQNMENLKAGSLTAWLAPKAKGLHYLRNFEVMAVQEFYAYDFQVMLFRNLLGILREPHDPSKPLPGPMRDRIRALEREGLRLPKSMWQALDAGGPARRFSRRAEGVYSTLVRQWDGGRPLAYSGVIPCPYAIGVVFVPAPVIPGINAPAVKPGRFTPGEKLLGDLLSGALQKRFSSSWNKKGRELLNHFRDQRGVVRLPAMTVIKISQRPGEGGELAHYDGRTRTVVFDYWSLMQELIRAAPAGDRPMLEGKGRPGGMSAKQVAFYLGKPGHAEIFGALIDRIDDIAFHELTHAYQDRRDPVVLELMRGNVSRGVGYPVEQEQEAYLATAVYSLEKYLHAPSSASRTERDSFECALRVLRDPRVFAARLGHHGDYRFTTNSLEELEKWQRYKRTVAEKIQPGTLYGRARGAVRDAGYDLGSAAIRQAKRTYARSIFGLEREVFGMRREAASRLSGALEARRPDLALRVYDAAAGGEWNEGRLGRLMRETIAFLKGPGRALPLRERYEADGVINQVSIRHHEKFPRELEPMRRRDLAAKIDQRLEIASLSPRLRERMLALSYEQAMRHLPKDSIQRRELAAAYLKERPDLSLLLLGWRPAHPDAAEISRRSRVVGALVKYLRASGRVPARELDERVRVYKILRDELKARKESFPPEALRAVFVRDVRNNIARLLAVAAREPSLRAKMLHAARSWLKELPPRDPLRTRVLSAFRAK